MGSEAAPDTPWRALHPASLAVNLLPQAWRTFRGLWPLLLFLMMPGRPKPFLTDLVTLMGMAVVSVGSTAIHYFTLRYRLHDGRLEIRSGLLNRRARTVDPARIQNLALVQNPFHKVAGLVELRMDLAGDPSSDGLLSALSIGEAEALRSALEAARGRMAEASDAPAAPLLRNGLLEVLAYGLSQRRLGALALLSVVFAEGSRLMAPEESAALTQRLGAQTSIALFFLAVAASWAISAGGALLRHAGFRLHQVGDRLITEEGLLTRRRVEIPLQKVQTVEAEEPLLRRLMGYGTLNVETAALSFEEGQVRKAETALPMVPTEQLWALVSALVPSLALDPWTAPLRPAHPRALVLACAGALATASFWALGFCVLLWPVLGAWGALAFAATPLALPLAWLDWRWQGWAVTEDAIVARRGFLNRHTLIVSRAKVQGLVLLQGPVLHLLNLGQVGVRAAGSALVLPLMEIAEARALLEAMGDRPAESLRSQRDREAPEAPSPA